MAPWAKTASEQTGIDANVILAQWGIETGWGTSYQWTQHYNPAGIGITSDSVQGQNYGSIGAGVAAYVNFVNNNSRYQAVKSAQGAQAQAVAMGQSGWAASGYNNGGGPGSSLLATMGNLGVNADTGQAMPANALPGVGSASSAGAASNASGATAQAANPSAAAYVPQSSTNIGGTTYTGTQGNVSALSTLESTLSQYGFSGTDLTTLTNWAWQELTTNTDPSQIVLDLQTPGSAAYPIFEKQFPGYTAANQELIKAGLPAVSVSQYQQYETNAFAAAQAAGLPPGMLNKNNIGTLIGANVSSAELTSRMNDAVALAYQSTPEQRSMFNQYFGVQDSIPSVASAPGHWGQTNPTGGHGPLTNGQIAALTLDPKVAEPLIHQQITAAQIGGTTDTVGLGALSKAEAVKLAQAGIPGGVSMASFANLAPLEQALPGGSAGHAAQQVVGTDTLVEGNLLGTAADVRAQQIAQESRKAPFSGGGGFIANQSGVVGTGSGKQQGGATTQ